MQILQCSPRCRKMITCAFCCVQVVDEADRLLRQAYQDWLPFVVGAAAATPQELQLHGSALGAATGGRRVLKFVASATLTRDPAKLERLGLCCPRYLALQAADTRCEPAIGRRNNAHLRGTH